MEQSSVASSGRAAMTSGRPLHDNDHHHQAAFSSSSSSRPPTSSSSSRHDDDASSIRSRGSLSYQSIHHNQTPLKTSPSLSNHHRPHTVDGRLTSSSSSSSHTTTRSFGSPFSSPPPLEPIGRRRPRASTTASTTNKYPNVNHHQDSPFLSPPLLDRREKPAPLVLDPSAAGRSANSMGYQTSSSSSTHSRSSSSATQQQQQHYFGQSQQQQHRGHSSAHSSSRSFVGDDRSTVQKLLQAATQGIRDHHATAAIAHQYHQNRDDGLLHHATPIVNGNNNNSYHLLTSAATTASSLASQSSSSHAGFLQKLGQHIPEFKRRFFVLKPESNLYYFLSPNDVEPRGRIDLEGSTVEVYKDGNDNDGTNDGTTGAATGDGRHRFVISWPASAGDNTGGQNDSRLLHNGDNARRSIVLEARSSEIAKEWMKIMKQDRVSTLKGQVASLTNETTAQKNRIVDLERQIEHFCMVEKDRDGALEDARIWRSKFEKLDEALRLLTQQLRQPPESATNKERQNIADSMSSQMKEEEKKEEDVEQGGDEGGERLVLSKSNQMTDRSTDTDETPTQSNQRGAVLLDDVAPKDMDVEEMVNVPGTYFSALSNSCRQQRESLRLAYVEAATAVDDVVEANKKVETIQKRMEKAEKELLKLWEENCSVRKTLKQKKRERRVLVNEVKQLQAVVQKLQGEADSRNRLLNYSLRVPESDGQMADTMIGSDEERLIDELEEHVASSIQLHERLLAGTGLGVDVETDLNSSMDQSTSTNHSSHHLDLMGRQPGAPGIKFEKRGSKDPDDIGDVLVDGHQNKLLSLMDNDSDTGSGDEDDVLQKCVPASAANVFVSTAASAASTEGNVQGREIWAESIRSGKSSNPQTSPERSNPILNLDEDDGSGEADRNVDLRLSATRVTENGMATARLVCPLTDVADSVPNFSSIRRNDATKELQVHHLTFYSKKIGIQFQKAPPSPVKPRGLLNDAMMADLKGDTNGSYKTAAELRGVASIASLASGGERQNDKEHCVLAQPEHIVLVCGFEGFDDSGINQRPMLGARLVAFDGVSVEVGKWTFDGIRKAIKARGRPLTLSFRNDYLTTEQRAVLTRAVKEVDTWMPPNLTTFQSLSSAPSINSTVSEPAYDASLRDGTREVANPGWHHFQPSSSNSSVSSGYNNQHIRRLSSTSTSTHRNNNFRSFSDAGSSVVSNSFAPLMTNLMKGVSSTFSEDDAKDTAGHFEPEYLRRQPQRSESTPQHQDFRSNLL